MIEDANVEFNKYKGKIDDFEESFFGINEIHNLDTSTVDMLIYLIKVNDKLHNMNRLEDYEDVIDLSHDLSKDIDKVVYELGEIDKVIDEVLNWGESWKKLALRLIEDGNFDLNDYMEVMK